MKKLKLESALRAAACAVVAIAVIFQFQNCSLSPGGVASSSSSGDAKMVGGNGYDGKTRRYVIWDSTGLCSDQISDEIDFDFSVNPSGAAVRTRRGCQDIPPEPVILTSFGIMKHNLENLIADQKPYDFDLGTSIIRTGLLCRGEVEKRDSNVRVIGDVRITSSTVRGFRGKTFIGVYDSTTGELLKQENGTDIELIRKVGENGWDEYINRTDEGGKQWRLEVPPVSGDLGFVHIRMSDTETIHAKIPCYRP